MVLSLKFECEVITPLFMAGADGRTLEQPRPSSFKGMIRFWWRAVKSESDVARLKREEAYLFGGVEEDQGKSSKSKVQVRIESPSLSKIPYPLLPHHKGTNKVVLRDAIPPGYKFNVNLCCYENRETYKNIFLITVILGGFGRRSRRGFGSIKINNFPEYKNAIHNLQELCNMLNRVAQRDIYKIEVTRIRNTNPVNNYPCILEVEIGKQYNDYNFLLQEIGKSSGQHKNHALGCAKPRMASPIYVSVIHDGTYLRPIITTLYSKFPPSDYPSYDLKKQDDFKRGIL